jgi:hypothetical protein
MRAVRSSTSNVTVAGNGFTPNGGDVQRGFFVYSGITSRNTLRRANHVALPHPSTISRPLSIASLLKQTPIRSPSSGLLTPNGY